MKICRNKKIYKNGRKSLCKNFGREYTNENQNGLCVSCAKKVWFSEKYPEKETSKNKTKPKPKPKKES
jgi:hypothetical protein